MSIINKPSFKIAFGGLMAALSVAILLLCGVIPILTYIGPLVASILLIPVDVELGKKWSWMTWVVVSILGLVLCADKEAAFFYIFVGYYPLIKEYLDRIKSKTLRILAKLGIFAAAIGAMYVILIFVLALPSVITDFEGASIIINILLIVVMVFIMLCFDVVAAFASRYYTVRIRPKLRSMGRH